MKTNLLIGSSAVIVALAWGLAVYPRGGGRQPGSEWAEETKAAVARASANIGKLDSNRIDREVVGSELKFYREMEVMYESRLRSDKSASSIALDSENLRDARERIRILEEKQRRLDEESGHLESNR